MGADAAIEPFTNDDAFLRHVSRPGDVKSFAEEIHNEFGAMDVIMNIAGISLWGEIQNLEHQHWQKCINIDLWGLFI